MLKWLLDKSPIHKARAATCPSGAIDGMWAALDLAERRMIFAPVKLENTIISALVDSGTSRTIINSGLARELGLVPLGETSVTSFTRRVAGVSYRAATMELAGTILKDFVFDSYETADIEALARRQLPLIVGRDVLKKIDVEIDFIGDRIRWTSPGPRRNVRPGLRLPLCGERAAFPSIDLAIEGMTQERCLLDLGSDAPVTRSAAFAKERGLFEGRRQSTAVSIGLEGVLTNIAFTLRNVSIGDFAWHDVPVQAVENWKLAQPISVGWPLFQAFHIVLSLGARTMDMTANRQVLASPIPRDRLGISGRREEQRLVISHVAPGSPAWHAGLRGNDVLVNVDGRAISRGYPAPGDRVGFRAPGSVVRLGLADGRTLEIMLIDYY